MRSMSNRERTNLFGETKAAVPLTAPRNNSAFTTLPAVTRTSRDNPSDNLRFGFHAYRSEPTLEANVHETPHFPALLTPAVSRGMPAYLPVGIERAVLRAVETSLSSKPWICVIWGRSLLPLLYKTMLETPRWECEHSERKLGDDCRPSGSNGEVTLYHFPRVSGSVLGAFASASWIILVSSWWAAGSEGGGCKWHWVVGLE